MNTDRRGGHGVVGVAFDGKTLRGARHGGRGRVSLLGAAEHGTGVILAQREIGAKTNEIPELRAMLGEVDLTECVLTADALHCQADTAKAVIAAGGHYLLTIKSNQARPLQQVRQLMAGADTDWGHAVHDSGNRGHGRTE